MILFLFSKCDEVELFINGKSCTRKFLTGGSSDLAERYRFIWHDLV